MTTPEALEALRTYRQTVLVGPDAHRAKALEIRRQAKAEGLKVSIKSEPRLIELRVVR
jgi:hypothetical protein